MRGKDDILIERVALDGVNTVLRGALHIQIALPKMQEHELFTILQF